jgi:hypothetical protein
MEKTCREAGRHTFSFSYPTPQHCDPERSMSVRRTVMRSRGTPCPQKPATAPARSFFHGTEGRRERSANRGPRVSYSTSHAPGPSPAGTPHVLLHRSNLRLPTRNAFPPHPQYCHPERSMSVRRTVMRSRGTPCPQKPGTALREEFLPRNRGRDGERAAKPRVRRVLLNVPCTRPVPQERLTFSFTDPTFAVPDLTFPPEMLSRPILTPVIPSAA